MSKVEEVYQRLMSFTKTLEMQVHGENYKHLRDILSDNKELPDGCPSRASLAILQIGSIREALDEVNAAYQALEDAIWNEGW